MEWLKNELKARGLTQRDIGEAIGLDDGKMSRVMSGERKLSATEADNIRRFLGFTLPDDEASELDRRILRALSQMTEQEKAALAVLLPRKLEND